MSYIEKFWRDATDKDVVDVMNDKEIEARFRDNAVDRWIGKSFLGGWAKHSLHPWLDENRSGWTFCQVYAPDQWWLDKPDPGPEHVLLKKFPDEALQPGDEALGIDGKWRQSYQAKSSGAQVEGIWYRRRIEPKPEPKYAVGQRVKVIGPVCGEGPIYNWTKEMDEYIGAVGTVRLKPTQDPEGTFYAVGEIVGWSFREDYLEPVVEPEPKHYTLQVGDTAEFPNWFTVKALENGILIK